MQHEWISIMLNETKQVKKYILYDSMTAFGNVSQCVMTKKRLVIACVRRKGRGRQRHCKGDWGSFPGWWKYSLSDRGEGFMGT